MIVPANRDLFGQTRQSFGRGHAALTNVSSRKDLAQNLDDGKLIDEDVMFHNFGECELDPTTDYYELGKLVKSWTEINGMVAEDNHIFDNSGTFRTSQRFLPKLDNVKIISYPWAWFLDQIVTHAGVNPLVQRVPRQRLSVFQDVRNAEKPTRLFTSMMRRTAPHRVMMWDLLNHAGLVGSQPYGPDSVCTNVVVEGYQIDLPYGQPVWGKDQHIFPEWYFDCAIDVVCETITNHLFYTEKTWKPLMSMRIPLYLSGKAHYQKLTEAGFRFPDWLQHESFDYLETDYLRCKRIVEILLELKSQDWQKLFDESWDIRVHNQENCLKILIDGSVPPPPPEVATPEYMNVYETAKKTAELCWNHLSH